MKDKHPIAAELADTPRARGSLLGFGLCLGASIIISTAISGVAFTVPVLMSGLDPITVASHIIGHETPVLDPLILARESDPRLIEPAAGPACDD